LMLTIEHRHEPSNFKHASFPRNQFRSIGWESTDCHRCGGQ
jgi:hypothetical protein